MSRIARAHALLPALSAVLLVACGPAPADPDVEWSVTVTGESTDCTEATEGFQQTYTYQAFYDDSNLSAVEIKIDGESFASGYVAGCTLSYQSAIWREDEDGGIYRWQIVGEAEVNTAAGGCDIPNELDWMGTETLVVVESENETVPEGCTYNMVSEGTLAGGNG